MGILYGYMFIVGIVFGSFFNVVGLRIPNGQSIVSPGSHCFRCGHHLKALELIPVFSYILQKGKCKNCSCRISPIYPLFELATGILFMIAPFFIGWNKELIIALVLISLLVIIFVSDIHYMIIPDKVLIFFGIILVGLRVWIPLDFWWNSYVGAIAGFSLLLLIYYVSRGGMGEGDVKLFAVLGLVLGIKNVLLAFFLSTFYGTVFGLIGMMIGKVKKGKPIPFGPYIVLGALTAYFLGNEIFKWYASLFMR